MWLHPRSVKRMTIAPKASIAATMRASQVRHHVSRIGLRKYARGSNFSAYSKLRRSYVRTWDSTLLSRIDVRTRQSSSRFAHEASGMYDGRSVLRGGRRIVRRQASRRNSRSQSDRESSLSENDLRGCVSARQERVPILVDMWTSLEARPGTVFTGTGRCFVGNVRFCAAEHHQEGSLLPQRRCSTAMDAT